MSYDWEKLGQVYVADGEAWWMQSRAYVPTPHVRDDGRVRVYVAFLDDEMVGRVGYVDIREDEPTQVVDVSNSPVFDVGDRGTFDCHGVTPTSIVESNDRLLLYYFGWQRLPDIRYYLFTGVAVSHDGGDSFERISEVPLLDRTDGERYVRSAPCVVSDDEGYRMWYVSGNELVDVNGKVVPSYGVRHKRSREATDWDNESGTRCLDPAGDDEYGFGRPFVRRTDEGYQMWYSVRTHSKGYRIGMAESTDGLEWTRRDAAAGIDVSEHGWDSEMICFPNVVTLSGAEYMFYNGNNFGETGFGVARLKGSQRWNS